MPQIDLLVLEKQVLEEEAVALEAFHKGTGEAPVIYRSESGAVTKAVSDGPIEFVASHESDDRMGDIIRQDGWKLDNFKKNPLMLWSHNAFQPPIGKWSNVRVDAKALLATASFDADDEFSALIEGKVRRGFLNAVSVGFRPITFEYRPEKEGQGGMFRPAADFKEQELLEISIVAIPAHPKALRKALEYAIDGKPEAKHWLFLPGANYGTFEAKAVEPESAKAVEPAPAKTITVFLDGDADVKRTASAISRAVLQVKADAQRLRNSDAHAPEVDQVDAPELVKALNSLESAIRDSLSKSASPLPGEPAPVSTPDPEPSLKTEPEPASSEDTLAIEASLAVVRGALKAGEK